MNFTNFNLQQDLLKGIDAAGFKECMPVQEATFPHTFNKKDVFVQSQTGTGKSAAFLISIFNNLSVDDSTGKPQALILAPTRELAVQISNEAKLLGKFLPFRIGVFYGGVGYKQQEEMLKTGVDIIIGTPGRLIDFNSSGKLDFTSISILVIDEADRLFDMGFYPDIKRIMQQMPPLEKRQTMLFSATLDDKVKDLAANHMNEPEEILMEPDNLTVDKIEQIIYHVGSHEKFSLLLGLLRKESPKNFLIFTNTKNKAVEISKRLEYNGYNCTFLIGDLTQKKRLRIIENVKKGKIKYLIATDVAARGLHIDDLDLVINYDLPENKENYVHRIGRTARAGNTGKAITLACEHFVYSLDDIEQLIDKKIPVEWADNDLYIEDKSRGQRIETRKKSTYLRDRKKTMQHHKQSVANKRSRPARPHQKNRYNQNRSSGNAAIYIKSKPQQRVKNTFITKIKQKVKSVFRILAKYRNKSLDNRLKYYNKKYGENFTVKKTSTKKTTSSQSQAKHRKKGKGIKEPQKKKSHSKTTKTNKKPH